MFFSYKASDKNLFHVTKLLVHTVEVIGGGRDLPFCKTNHEETESVISL